MKALDGFVRVWTRYPSNDPWILMTPDQLIETLRVLGWSSRELARRVKCGHQTAHNWVTGAVQIPGHVAGPLWRLRAFHEANPVAPFRQTAS